MNRRTQALLLAQRYPGGIEALAAQMGKRPDTLRKELTAVAGYKFGTDEEDMLMDLCAAARVDNHLAPLQAAAISRGATLMQLPVLSGSVESFACIADAAREFSEFVATLAQAEADGRVTANELKRIEKEAGELMGSLQRCMAHAREKHEAGKPAALKVA